MPGLLPEADYLLEDAADPFCLLVLAHGAGAGMNHAFMAGTARELAGLGVSTLRYQFPYMSRGSRRPDAHPVLRATVDRAVATALELRPGLPLLAGGKSMGGRMTSLAASGGQLPPEIRGLVFLGFPLHPAGLPSADRASHLSQVSLPMLFLQGERDRLADLDLLRPVIAGLQPRATLRVLESADHSFALPARSGKTPSQVLGILGGWIRHWILELLASEGPTR